MSRQAWIASRVSRASRWCGNPLNALPHCHSWACCATARQWRGCGDSVPPSSATGSGGPQSSQRPVKISECFSASGGRIATTSLRTGLAMTGLAELSRYAQNRIWVSGLVGSSDTTTAKRLPEHDTHHNAKIRKRVRFRTLFGSAARKLHFVKKTRFAVDFHKRLCYNDYTNIDSKKSGNVHIGGYSVT